MELKKILETLRVNAALRGLYRLTRSRVTWIIVLPLVAGTLSFLAWNRRSRGTVAAPSAAPGVSTPVTSLAGAPDPTLSASGEILPAQRLVPLPGQVLIQYFEPQAPQPPHVSFVERKPDSTKLYWFRYKECETERKCPYWPWWRKSDVNAIVVPDDFVVGIMEPHNICHGRLSINADSDYTLACEGPRLRVVSAPSKWRGKGQLPKKQWLAAAWNPQEERR